MNSKPVLFALEGSQAFGHSVTSQLGISPASHEDRNASITPHSSASRPASGTRLWRPSQ